MATLTLGAFGSGLRGKTSSTVFVQTAGGVVVRDRVIPANPQTPAQQANRYRLARATQAWSKLGPEQIAAWEAYAQRLAVRDPGSGLMRAPRPQNLFVSLYSKLLQLNPIAGVPGNPPANPFFGDNLSLTVGLSTFDSTTFDLRDKRGTIDDERCSETIGERRSADRQRLTANDGETTSDERRNDGRLSTDDLTTDDCPDFQLSTFDFPPAHGQRLTANDALAIQFTASAPNAPGVTTELLLQPLESAVRRTYLEKYRHAAFFAFAAGALSVEVPVPTPGWYACGYRFVNTATGQDTGVVECGKVLVE